MARKLKAEMSKIIRNRIPLTDKELVQMTPSELFQAAYAALEGIRERTGKNDGTEVEMLQYTVGLKKGDAWCMAAAQTACRFVELWLGITSEMYVSGHCLTTYKNSKSCQVASPEEGDLIIYQHGDTTSGHVEGIQELGFRSLYAYTMGGNTSSGPGVNSDGDGVYYRMRSLRGQTGDMKIYGYLRPFPKAKPQSVLKADA
jgi:hypothetical protein